MKYYLLLAIVSLLGTKVFGRDTMGRVQQHKYSIGIGLNFITTIPTPQVLGSTNEYGELIPQQIMFRKNYKINRGIGFGLANNSRAFNGQDPKPGATVSIDFLNLIFDHYHYKIRPKSKSALIESFYFRYGMNFGQSIYHHSFGWENYSGRFQLLSPGLGIGGLKEFYISSHFILGAVIRYQYYFETPKYSTSQDEALLKDLNAKPNRQIASFSVYLNYVFRRIN